MTSPGSLLDILKETASAFEAKGVRYAVSGGMAVLAYGFVRATRALDILISVPAIQLPGAIEPLLDLGCEGDVHSVI